MRKTMMILIVAFILTTRVYANSISLIINNLAINMPEPPVLEAGTTLVPLRVIGEELEATVRWVF